MKILTAFLVMVGIGFAQSPPTAFVAGQVATAAGVNANFTGLWTGKVSKFSGSGTPGSLANSSLGDDYTNTANGDVYKCQNLSGACTAVASGNWVKQNTGGTGTPAGSTNDVQFNSAGSFGGGRCTMDSSQNFVCTGSLTGLSFTGSDTSHSGLDYLKGKTSGGVAFGVDDVAGTAIAYILPSTNGVSGQYLEDSGSTTCPTLPSGAPATCHQLTWNTPTGTGTIATTTSALKGDGAGNASAVPGTGSNCVHVDGTSAVCAAGAVTQLFPVGSCNNGGASSPLWSTDSTSNPAGFFCVGSSTGLLGGIETFTTTSKNASVTFVLLSTSTDLTLTGFQNDGQSGVASFQFETACGSTYGGLTWNTAQQTNTQTNPTTATLYAFTKTGITLTGCSVGDTVHVRIRRGASDTYTGETDAMWLKVVSN